MEEEEKVDESTEQKVDESTDRKPSEYEIQLRKENEKLRKDLQSKLEAEQKAKEGALKEQGKYKELYESVSPKLTTLESENATLKSKVDAIESETRKELLDRFPEGKRDAVKDLPLETLRDLAKFETTETKGSSFSGRPGKTKLQTEGKKWEDFTFDQRKQINKDNPDEYNRLYKDKFGRNPS